MCVSTYISVTVFHYLLGIFKLDLRDKLTLRIFSKKKMKMIAIVIIRATSVDTTKKNVSKISLQRKVNLRTHTVDGVTPYS